MTHENHPATPADAAGSNAAAPKSPAATPPPTDWRRLLTFLTVLVVGMALAWMACAYFPATPAGPRKAKADTRTDNLRNLGLIRAEMPPMHRWQYIVLHHTATDGASVDSIDQQHRQLGWKGIGYHFVIGNGNDMEDGLIEPTYRWWEQKGGAHALADGSVTVAADAQLADLYNRQGLGIVLVGNFNNRPPTQAQLDNLVPLIADLADRFNVPMSGIIGHREVKATDCPGKQFPMAEVLRRVADLRISRMTPKKTN